MILFTLFKNILFYCIYKAFHESIGKAISETNEKTNNINSYTTSYSYCKINPCLISCFLSSLIITC